MIWGHANSLKKPNWATYHIQLCELLDPMFANCDITKLSNIQAQSSCVNSWILEFGSPILSSTGSVRGEHEVMDWSWPSGCWPTDLGEIWFGFGSPLPQSTVNESWLQTAQTKPLRASVNHHQASIHPYQGSTNHQRTINPSDPSNLTKLYQWSLEHEQR